MLSKKKGMKRPATQKNIADDKFENLSSLTSSGQILSIVRSEGENNPLNRSGRKSDGNRKSLPFLSDSQDTNVENDRDSDVTDVEERIAIRDAQVSKTNLEQTKSSEKVDNKTKNLLTRNLGPQALESHYTQCIELFSKNKVNVKNAFKLQLIDFMKLMMDRKTEKSENLTLMSCTLDASAKIYSCRVDNVYSNILKFIKAYHSGGKLKDEDKGNVKDGSPSKNSSDDASSGEEGGADGKNRKKKGKLKTPKKTFVKEPESFNRKELKMCYYRRNLPRNQTYFLESAVLDDGHILAPNRPLFPKYSPDSQNISSFTINSVWSGAVDQDNFEEKIPGYQDLRSKIFIADDGPEDNTDKENAYTYDPSIESIAEIKNFNEISDGISECGDDNLNGEVEMDYDDCDMEPIHCDNFVNHSETFVQNDTQPASPNGRTSIPESNSSKPVVSFTPIAMTRLLRSATSKKSDYSFFDDSKMAFMPSATHWKIKPSKRTVEAVGKTPGQKRRGKTMYLDYCSEEQITSAVETVQEVNNVSHKLSIKTTKDWFYKKTELIFMAVIPNIRKQLISSFKDPVSCILNVVKDPESDDVNERVLNTSVLLNPVDFAAADADSLDGDNGNDLSGGYHPLEDWSEQMDQDHDPDQEISNTANPENDVILEMPEENSTDYLVPLPMKVEKVSVKFSKFQKRIDIKKLKGVIWNLLSLDNTNTENKENEKDNSKAVRRNDVKYSEVYKCIPSSISKEASAELSYPIAFMAILHMANEKCLRLKGNEDHSDFTVQLDTPL